MTKPSFTVISLVIILFGHTPYLAAEPKTTGLDIVYENAGKAENNFEVGDFDDPQRQVAQAPDSSLSQNWTYTVTPYLWITSSVKGNATVGRAPPAEFDLDFSDVLDFLEFGAAARVEAWKGRFGLILDASYADLGAEISTPGPDLDVDIKQTVIDFLIGYEVARIPISASERKPPPKNSRAVSIQLLGGGRYNYLKQELDLKPGPTFGGSASWFEPVVGARVMAELSERWTVTARGDIGGFGIGEASDLTWNFLAGFDYRAWENTSIKFGYRIYDIDYESGSGADTLGLDMRIRGPLLAVTMHF